MNLEFKRTFFLYCTAMELMIAEALQRGVTADKVDKFAEAQRL